VSLLARALSRSMGEREKRVLRIAGYAVVGGLAVWRGALFASGVVRIL
jgi:hypothetical protein